MLAQQRAEFERSQQEANTLANQLSQALAERDGHAAASKDNAQRIAALTRENNLMNKQLDDLGRQVRTLARDIARRDDPTIPSDEELDADTSIIPCESTEELITNNLVLFKSIDTMQQQNQRLLKIVRELGDKLEHGEGELRKQLEEEQDVAVQEAVQAINHLEKQLELQKANHESALAAASSQIESYRTMLARAGQSAPTQVPTAGSTGQMDVDDEASRKLAEMKEHFEAYDTEMGEDTRRLREEVIAHQRDVLHLQSALKKAEAKVDVVGEHHRILQEQHTLFKREHDELLLRHQKLQLQYARAEMEYNRAADDLLGAHGENDQLRNECANLRAEKRIWAGVEGRLVEENKALALERSRLSDLMANVQRMHNDLERSGENDRRRLESQLENMQSQMSVFLGLKGIYGN
jgi:nucleoprotein TPR